MRSRHWPVGQALTCPWHLSGGDPVGHPHFPEIKGGTLSMVPPGALPSGPAAAAAASGCKTHKPSRPVLFFPVSRDNTPNSEFEANLCFHSNNTTKESKLRRTQFNQSMQIPPVCYRPCLMPGGGQHSSEKGGCRQSKQSVLLLGDVAGRAVQGEGPHARCQGGHPVTPFPTLSLRGTFAREPVSLEWQKSEHIDGKPYVIL